MSTGMAFTPFCRARTEKEADGAGLFLSCAANGVEVYGRTRRADLFSCRRTTRSPDREDQTLLLRYPPSFLLSQCQKEGRCQGFRAEPPEDAIRGSAEDRDQH